MPTHPDTIRTFQRSVALTSEAEYVATARCLVLKRWRLIVDGEPMKWHRITAKSPRGTPTGGWDRSLPLPKKSQ